LFISYSAAGEYAALGYSDAVELYSLGISLQLITRVAASSPRDALWNDTTLFVASDSTINAHFIVPPAPPDKQLVQTTSMALQSGSDGLPELTGLPTASAFEVQSLEIATTKVSRGRALSASGGQSELPPVSLRPGALWRLVCATHDMLWMCSSSGHPWAVALQHSGYRCRALALRGELKAARLEAAAGLHPRYHDGLARFLSAFGSDGAAEALLLPGALRPLAVMASSVSIGTRTFHSEGALCSACLWLAAIALAAQHLRVPAQHRSFAHSRPPCPLRRSEP
jgi:hypothetical protein